MQVNTCMILDTFSLCTADFTIMKEQRNKNVVEEVQLRLVKVENIAYFECLVNRI